MNESDMDKAVQIMLKQKIEPLCAAHRDTFRTAMLLRINVHMSLAKQSGAEEEDMPAIMVQAIKSALSLTTKYFDDLGEVSKAQSLKKES